MSQIPVRELYGLYLDTIQRCNRNLLSQSDEELEHELFEEFDVGAYSFLHDDNLQRLRDSGCLDDEVVVLSRTLREKWVSLENEPRSAAFVRTNQNWHELFDLSERIGDLLRRDPVRVKS